MKKIYCLLSASALLAIPAMAITPNGAGVYEISTPDELEEFAAIVNGGQRNASAVLTKDIDMDGVKHTLIGNTQENSFKGTWDGRFHTISCLNMEEAGAEYAALFGFVGAGAKICNTVIDDLSTFKSTVSGAAFVAWGDDTEEGFVEFECLGNSGAVECINDEKSGYGAAIAGPSASNKLGYRFTNCYNLGEIHGNTVGAMSSKVEKAVCKSCFTVTNVKKLKENGTGWGNPGIVATVLIAGVKDFVEDWGYNFFFGGKETLPTIFYIGLSKIGLSKDYVKWTDYNAPAQPDNHGIYKVFEAWWAPTGAMCWFLNNCSDENPVWGQNLEDLDSYPTFVPGKPIVTKKADAFEFENINKNTTSAVTEIAAPLTEGTEEIYNIQGIKVNSMETPGLYIVKGKKILVR